MSLVLLGVTAVISLIALPDLGGSFELQALLAMDKPAVANGELWRIWTVTLPHAGPLQLLFHGYALLLAGPIVEQLYGRVTFPVFYLVSAAGGSIGTYAFGPAALGVGASGAIFGLFGIVLAASRTHNPVLDPQGRRFVTQIGRAIHPHIAFV